VDFSNGLTPPTTLASGTRQIVNLHFGITPGATLGAATPVSFTNTVFNTRVNDANGLALALPGGINNGTVTVLGPTGLVFGNVTTNTTHPALVPVMLTSTGNAYTVSFTANFTPTALSISNVSGAGNPDVIPGAGLPGGCVENVNTSQVAAGRIGVSISCPIAGPAMAAAGTQTIATLRFTPVPGVAQGTLVPITFSNSPFGTGVADVNGNPIVAAQVNGSVQILGPTAAEVSISGLVALSSGQGLRNAEVYLQDAAGNRQVAITSTFGYFEFNNVESGQTYVIGVSSKRYHFDARSITIADNLTDVNFISQ
jgi:hypothetical protein